MKLSVIINTRKNPEGLAKALESLEKQTDKEFEVIIADQSKNRKSKALVRPYNLKYYRIKKRGNRTTARNFALNSVSGDVVAFLGDTAQAAEQWVESIKEVFKDTSIECVSGPVTDLTSPENPITAYRNASITGNAELVPVNGADDISFEKGGKNKYPAPSPLNAAFRLESVTRLGGFDENLEYTFAIEDMAVRLINAKGRGFYKHEAAVELLSKPKSDLQAGWREAAKSRTYFILKNNKTILPIRILPALSALLSSNGALRNLVSELAKGKIIAVLFPYFCMRIALGTVQGVIPGLLSGRNIRKFDPDRVNKFVLFKKR